MSIEKAQEITVFSTEELLAKGAVACIVGVVLEDGSYYVTHSRCKNTSTKRYLDTLAATTFTEMLKRWPERFKGINYANQTRT